MVKVESVSFAERLLTFELNTQTNNSLCAPSDPPLTHIYGPVLTWQQPQQQIDTDWTN